MNDKFPDKIFVKDHLTAQEKLMFANSYISDLKSRISELQILLGQSNSEVSELKHVSKEDRKEILADERIKMLKKTIENNKKLIFDLRSTNERLIIEILKYRT